MRKKLLLFSGAAIIVLVLLFVNPFRSAEVEGEEMEENESEMLRERYDQQFEQMKDPALGQVPSERLLTANAYTRQLQKTAITNRVSGLGWQERGPIYDFVGPSNGNSRAGGEYTAGIVQTFLVDQASDPTGNIVLAGSPSGGLWRCTNFLSTTTPPNWQPINDFMANLAIASICQDPSNPSVMYLATGDANTRDVQGYGIWKSTNYGINWTLLPSTVTYKVAFKILCDNTGNVYLASGGGGLKRSNDGGATWTTISPSNVATFASNSSYVTDLEISSTGRLHAIFGYYGTKVKHYYTDIPASVTPLAGWIASIGIRSSGASCARAEIAVQGDLLYAVTANASFNVDSSYKSTDGGLTWTKQNTTGYTASIANTQAWFALILEINPDNPAEFIVGSVDTYKSINEGQTVSRMTYWVGATAPYVHADHHAARWFKVGTESRLIIGSDGGMFLSRNGGATFVDRNQNLGIKQFYSCAISPTASVNYLLAGSQDNGTHQLKNAGLSFSTEVTGGDGGFVHINQQNPLIQFGTYVYNNYRRSVDGGQSWSQINITNANGYFINPYTYDDAQNTLFASNASSTAANNQVRRLNNANTASSASSNVLTITELTRGTTNGNATSFKSSAYTANRLFIGGNNGKLLRLENASTVTTSSDITANITDITGSSFPVGYLNCINTGTSDNVLVACFTNYGVQNVWYSTDGGSSWTGIDGNLPDMPVWWAAFEPGSDSKLILGTETGVYATSAVNGGSTVWTADPGFPVVRTTMLQIRQSDKTIVASTYGRGLYTASLNNCTLASITTQPANQTSCTGSNITLSVVAGGTGLTYQWRKGGVNITGATASSYTINAATAANAGNYDVVITNSCGNTTSATATITISTTATVNTQPANQAGCVGGTVTFNVSASGSGLIYQWRKGGVNITGATNSSLILNNLSASDVAAYDVVIGNACGSNITSASASLTVNAGTAISTQPTSQVTCANNNVNLTVAATGGNLTYQWRKDGIAIAGANSASYAINNITIGQAGNYDVVVSGACGNANSASATVTVNAATNITTQPAAQSGCAGTAATFTVGATGAGTLGYQWRKGGVNITGATAATYTIPSTTVGDAGNYDVVVTGSCGSVTSGSVALTVATGGGCTTAIPNVDADVTQLVMMPNVVTNAAVLRIKVARTMQINWSVVDASGRTIMTFSQRATAGQNDMPLQLNRLARGSYYLQGATEKGKLGTIRFEKL